MFCENRVNPNDLSGAISTDLSSYRWHRWVLSPHRKQPPRFAARWKAYGIWTWAIGNYWETVYSYVFPAWAQPWIPEIAFVVAGSVALSLWLITIRLKRKFVLTFCLMGGVIGSVTHIWAVYRGIVTKPPMLQGASPLAAVVIAFFEYIFYWCTILVMAKIMNWVQMNCMVRGLSAGGV